MKNVQEFSRKELLRHRRVFYIAYFANLYWVLETLGAFGILYWFFSALLIKSLSENEVILCYSVVIVFLLIGVNWLCRVLCRVIRDRSVSILDGVPRKIADSTTCMLDYNYDVNFPDHSLRLQALLQEKRLKAVSASILSKRKSKI